MLHDEYQVGSGETLADFTLQTPAAVREVLQGFIDDEEPLV